MIIKSVKLPRDYNGNGLCEIEMSRLGSVVAIAGKNGSGKTRLLNHISIGVNNGSWMANDIEMIKSTINAYEEEIKSNPTSPELESWENAISMHKQTLDSLGHFSFSEVPPNYKAILFVPRDGELIDSDTLPKIDVIGRHDSCFSGSIENFTTSVFSYIQTEQNRWYSATHQNSYLAPVEKDELIESYEALKKLIKKFIGTDIDRDIDDSCTIFGLKLGESKLSAGQKILLQLCVAIHAQGATLDSLILILDEPENHLHPAALIDFVMEVLALMKNGQVWIATHSISLLSQLETSSIWYMEENKVTYSGRTPEKVLNGLLGDDERKGKLRDFIGLPDALAAVQFAYQCLFIPNATTTEVEDDQTNQIRDIIKKMLETQTKLRILDYGAGKGRLADAIFFSQDDSKKKEIEKWLDYIAYDCYDTDKTFCQDAIARIYGNCDKRYFNNFNSLNGEIDKKSVDLIVMCNVLHEIPSERWISIFNEQSILHQLLKETGSLLIIEDLCIPVGEKPHEKGFLILGKTQIKELFGITEQDGDFACYDARKDERLMAYKIPKNYLNRITTSTCRIALESLKSLAKTRIEELRKEEDYKSGKLHALWSQQLANIILALDL